MSQRTAALRLIGAGLLALGSLWLLQGANAVHVRPVLCATNCRPVTGGSRGWLADGGVTALVGVAMIILGTKHVHHT